MLHRNLLNHTHKKNQNIQKQTNKKILHTLQNYTYTLKITKKNIQNTQKQINKSCILCNVARSLCNAADHSDEARQVSGRDCI